MRDSWLSSKELASINESLLGAAWREVMNSELPMSEWERTRSDRFDFFKNDTDMDRVFCNL